MVFNVLIEFFVYFFQQHLDDKHLARFLEAEGIGNMIHQVDSSSPKGAPTWLLRWKVAWTIVSLLSLFCVALKFGSICQE